MYALLAKSYALYSESCRDRSHITTLTHMLPREISVSMSYRTFQNMFCVMSYRALNSLTNPGKRRMHLECVKRKPFSRARSRCVFSHDPLILWRGEESHANIRMRCSVLYIAHFPTSYVHSLRSEDCPT